MKYLSLYCCATLLLIMAQSSFAQTGAQSLQANLQGYQQLSGQFTQLISSEKSTHTQTSTGAFWVTKPNKFRWHYITPYVQQIISNGTNVWIYDEDLEQVSIKQASNTIASSPLAIILGSASLAELFEVTERIDKEGLEWFSLVPKGEDSGFELIKLAFQHGKLSRMLLHDSFGQRTRLLFSDVAVHTPIDEQLFEFEVPQGADVFDETVN